MALGADVLSAASLEREEGGARGGEEGEARRRQR